MQEGSIAYLFSHSAKKKIMGQKIAPFLFVRKKEKEFFMSKNKKNILTALLLATLIILSRFLSIKTPITKISFAFIPTMLCATWLGPKRTVLLNVVADIIGATLFPTGPFFIGYTISTGTAGLIYGLLLYKKDANSLTDLKYTLNLVLSVVLVTLICNVGMNTLWISITTGKAFYVLLSSRIVKELIMVPIRVCVMIFVERILRIPFDKYIRSNND